MVSQMSDKYDRKNAGSEKQKFEADHVISYFKMEWKVLLAVTVSGLIYNLGLLAGPWFEGKMAGCLVDILGGRAGFPDMGKLVAAYVIAIAVVQSSRYIKRFYVRRFANNVNRRMKHVLYDSLVHKSRAELEEEGAGNVMTKAILDVDDCAEGMRKFTTEIFDTGVALLAYAGMILFYDWRLALLSMLFPPVSYFLAEKMKGIVQRTGSSLQGAVRDLKCRHLRPGHPMRSPIVFMDASRSEKMRMRKIFQLTKNLRCGRIYGARHFRRSTVSSRWRVSFSFYILEVKTCLEVAGESGMLRHLPHFLPVLPNFR